MIKKIILIFTLTISIPSLAQDIDPEKYVAEGAVQLFGAACLKFYPDPVLFEKWVSSNKFDVIPSQYTKGLVRETGGVAYSINNNGVRYALVAEPSNLCTVFVKEINLLHANVAISQLRSGLSSALTEKVSVSTKKLEKGSVKTTSLEYSKEGRGKIMTIIVSESNSVTAGFQLAMSAASQLRANKTMQPTPKGAS
jgi:hypothetical protein